MMSADRFLAVCYPITSMKYRTPIYALCGIALIWIVSFVAMLPIVLFAGLVQHHDSTSYTCNIKWPSEHQMTGYRIFILYDCLIGFVIPVGLICVFYTLLICRLKTTGSQIRNADRRRSHRKVTKLVTLIIVVFIVCWLPFWSFQVYNVFRPNGPLANWTLFLNYVFNIMSYANSMVNPLLYAFTNENFRESFISAFRCAEDPIRGARGRRWSEFVSGNNNSTTTRANNAGLRLPPKTNGEQGPDYEFTMLTSNSNSPAGNSTKQEIDASVQVEEQQQLTENTADNAEEDAKDIISGGVYTGPNSVDNT
jgi:heme/copper-type cytochrome/quinol oxidase subunit 2